MEYITTTQAAEKWGVSLRQVQRLLAANRVPGGMQYGHGHLIPADAEKPCDPRFEPTSTSQKSLSDDLADVLAATSVLTPCENPKTFINNIAIRVQPLYDCGFAYIRGDFERVIQCFRKIEGDDAVKLITCSLAIAAAISTGDYPLYLEIETWLKNIVKENVSADVTAVAKLQLASAYLGAMVPSMTPDWLANGDFSALPPQMLDDAFHYRAQYFLCLEKYESMLAVAQTALALHANKQEHSLPRTYLKLMCAAAYCGLGQTDDAKTYLLEVMRYNLPLGYTTSIAELAPFFRGLLEQLLEKEFPEYYKIVTRQWEHVATNWIVFHNRFAKDNITNILTLREYQMARLAAQGVPYAEIGERFFLSSGRVKNLTDVICEKLFLSGRNRRNELAKYVL